MSQKQICKSYKQKHPISQGKNKPTLGKKELYLTAKKPRDNYISLELVTPEMSFFDNKHTETVSYSV